MVKREISKASRGMEWGGGIPFQTDRERLGERHDLIHRRSTRLIHFEHRILLLVERNRDHSRSNVLLTPEEGCFFHRCLFVC